MKKLEFMCPDCGGTVIHAHYDAIVSQKVEFLVDEDGEVDDWATLGIPNILDAHVNHYQCANCGHRLFDRVGSEDEPPRPIKDEQHLRAWLTGNNLYRQLKNKEITPTEYMAGKLKV